MYSTQVHVVDYNANPYISSWKKSQLADIKEIVSSGLFRDVSIQWWRSIITNRYHSYFIMGWVIVHLECTIEFNKLQISHVMMM